MNPELTSIDARKSAQAAARRVAEQYLAALPVIGRDGRLLDAITADSAAAVGDPAWTGTIR